MPISAQPLPTTDGEIPPARALDLLRSARELRPVGQLVDASNFTLLCEIGDEPYRVIYKPIRGEQPLWD